MKKKSWITTPNGKLIWSRFVMTAFLTMFGLGLFAQVKQISGTVTDSSTRESIPGATVIVKGTTVGTNTDIDGTFKLTVPADSKVLLVSFIGYITQEIPIEGSNYKIALQPETTEMDEIVVMAYSTQKKSSVTGSVGSVRSEKLEQIQASSSSQALQGMISGVQVRNNVGAPGAEAQILIRGIGSYGASSDPLYVVDGAAYEGGLASINPSDIENISVLKDAAATSLYGSRAANGVVMVTTKTGKSQKPVINFSAKWGTSNLAVKMPERASAEELLELTWEAYYQDARRGLGGLADPLNDADARDYASADYRVLDFWYRRFNVPEISSNDYFISKYKNANGSFNLSPVGTDGKMRSGLKDVWNEGGTWDDMFVPKLRQEYNMDISGMSTDGKTRYFFSGSYLNDPSSVLIQKFDRWSGRANISSKLNKWLETGLNLSASQTARDLSTYSGGVRVARIMPTLYTPWTRNLENTEYLLTANGNKIPDMGTFRQIWAGYNPMANLGTKSENPDNMSFAYREENNVNGVAFLQINISENLKWKTTGNYEIITRNNQNFYSNTYGLECVLAHMYGSELKAPSGNGAESDTWQRKVYTINNVLSYQKTFGNHNISAMAGQESYSYYERYFGGSGDGIMVEGLYELNNITTNKDTWSAEDKYRLQSWLGELRYDYKNRYFISGSIRTDGSSRFIKENRWGKFWSASALWVLSQEDFMQGTSTWLNDLRLKASYGTTGNDNVGYYAYQGLYGLGDFNGTGTMELNRYPTPKLLWEKNRQFNTSLGFRVFNILTGELEYFERVSEDLIFDRYMPPSSGWPNGIEQNIGIMKNSGLELSLTAQAIKSAKFTWTIDYNFTYVKNKMLSLPDGDIYSSEGIGNFRITEGKSRYELWMVGFAGIDPSDGRNWYWKKNFSQLDAKGAPIVESWSKTKNFNEVDNTQQRDWKGSTLPWAYGALTNTFKYGDFDMSFMLYYSLGGKMIDQMYRESINFRGGFGLSKDLIKDRWTEENPNGKTVGRFSVADQSNIIKISDQIIFNNTYVRLRNISIGYTLPTQLLNRYGMSRARVFVSADNMLTFGAAAKRGTDPEININGVAQDGNLSANNTDDLWGPRKVFNCGIQMSF
jgi:TonB-linked SusC/RagA family outer membrane protein